MIPPKKLNEFKALFFFKTVTCKPGTDERQAVPAMDNRSIVL
jgi:hypothetical protein